MTYMASSDPKVTIIIPAFNTAAYLPEMLESIFAQSYSCYEVILVDDGSTDNTKEIVSAYRHQIRYIRQDNSGGPSHPRNIAIAQARGEYICIFDSDDLMMPEKLVRSIEFISMYPDLGLIFTNFLKFDDDGLMPGTHLDSYTHFWKMPKDQLTSNQYRIKSSVAFDSLFYENYIGTSSVIIPVAVLKAIGRFDEELRVVEDRDMWFRIARMYDFGFLNVIGHKYRVRAGSLSRSGMAPAEARIKVIRRYLGPELHSATVCQASSVISEDLFSIGYQLLINGELRAAREYFRQSWSHQPNLKAARGILLSLLGRRCFAGLRSLKSEVMVCLARVFVLRTAEKESARWRHDV